MKIEIDKLLEERMEEILQGTAEIVAETNVGKFHDTLRRKAIDGKPWVFFFFFFFLRSFFLQS